MTYFLENIFAQQTKRKCMSFSLNKESENINKQRENDSLSFSLMENICFMENTIIINNFSFSFSLSLHVGSMVLVLFTGVMKTSIEPF